jgi:dienelactone hydrolase
VSISADAVLRRTGARILLYKAKIGVSFAPMKKSIWFPIIAVILSLPHLQGQANRRLTTPLLKQQLQSPALIADQLRHFMLQKVPPLELPATAAEWTRQAEAMRMRELSAIYHGWPKEWLDSAPHFEQVGVMDRPGYRIVKLRYEVVPGMYSAALLYEPEHFSGKIPAILNVNGHGPSGKAVEHKQKRCINQARRGMMALDLEWFDYGELKAEGNDHSYQRWLDFEGLSGVGLFYLEMRRGLDYLASNPDVDQARIGVTGLSGGGWQTMLLSSLDTRVNAAVPVAGFSTLVTAIEHPEYAGNDPEQNAPDTREGVDNAQLLAGRAPRPTLLIFNDMDDCCFRADVVKQGTYLDMKPFYKLMGAPDNLQWYDNQDPGTHNYQIDSRERSYEFFDSVFHINASSKEDPDTDGEVQPEDALVVGLPENNLTILSLAQSMAKQIHHPAPDHPDAEWAQAQRKDLESVTRYKPVTVTRAWVLGATREKKLVTHSYRFEFSNGLSAPGVLFRAEDVAETAPATVIIADQGMASTMVDVGNAVTRGQRVLVLDPLFFGQDIPENSLGSPEPGSAPFAQMLSAIGERPLGLESAQLTAVIEWMNEDEDEGSSTPHRGWAEPAPSKTPVRMITIGPRAETLALVTAALEPAMFSGIEAQKSIATFMDIFDHPGDYRGAPDVFCLDLFRDFDIDTLTAVASPVRVRLSVPAPEPLFW